MPYDFIAKLLFSEQIQKSVASWGNSSPAITGLKKALRLGLLRLSVMFITDLMQKVHLPHADGISCRFIISGSSAPASSHRLGHKPTSGWDVILVDDIAIPVHDPYRPQSSDDRNPNSLKVCALPIRSPATR